MTVTLRALRPYTRATDTVRFKEPPYEAWERGGCLTATAHYAPRPLHRLLYRHSLPPMPWRSEARLCMAEGVSLSFDTFPAALCHEIVPLLWDVWPALDNRVARWLRQQRVRTCLMTCSEAMARLRRLLPGVAFHHVPEGIDETLYPAGPPLTERTIDLYTYGRLHRDLYDFPHEGLRVERGGDTPTFHSRLRQARVVVALPQCDVLPERTGGQETLTQRFWECMLSGTVMVGRAPQELVTLIGYNPVLPLDRDRFATQLRDITARIADFQPLADRNRRAALHHAPWLSRMAEVAEWLEAQGYRVR